MKAQEIDYILHKAINSEPEKKKKQLQTGNVHLLRSVFIAIDMTSTMSDKDFKPTRLSVTLKMVKKLLA